MLSLIPAVIRHPGMTEGLQRYGVADFLSWRITAERSLISDNKKELERETEWQEFMPVEMTHPKAGFLDRLLKVFYTRHLIYFYFNF